METHFFQYKNQVFQLEQVVNSVYRRLDEQDTRFIGGSSTILQLFMTNGQELRFTNEAADQVWGVLKACALNITPRDESAVENG